MYNLFWLACGGALGTMARYAVAVAIPRSHGGFGWPTLIVNCAGCFVFGCVWSLAVQRGAIGADLRVVLLAGFVGAFTTFSTYIFEVGELLLHSAYGTAAVYFLANNVVGLLLFFLGVWVGREN